MGVNYREGLAEEQEASVKISVGTAEEPADLDLLEQYRLAPQGAVRSDDIDARPPGWPQPEEHVEDPPGDEQRSAWAW